MSNINYIHRGRGVVLLYDGRQYFKKKTYVSGAQWWRCCNNLTKMKCTGSITMMDDEIQKEAAHVTTCTMDIARNTWAEHLETLKQKVTSTDVPIPKLYEETVSSYQNTGFNFAHEEPSLEEIKVGLYKKKNKSLGVPRVAYHDDIAGIIIPQKFEDFLLGDYNSDGIRIVLFASKTGIESMEKLRDFFGDGTYKCCISPFCQIYSIHGDFGSCSKTTNIRPLVYALMSHKTYAAYLILFEIIKSQINDWKPAKFTCDFERSTIKAVTTVFPDVTVKGCYHHFQESLIRKAKALKIFKAKHNRRCVFLCRGLALLPRNHITGGWKYIKDLFGNDQHLRPFLKYFKSQCIIKQWSCFGERHRTNNYVEGWHTILSKYYIKKYNRNMLDVIVAFQKDSKSKRKANQRKPEATIADAMICEDQLRLINGQVSVGHFLEMTR